MKFLKNNMANISMDFLTAISILLFAMMFSIVAIGQMMTPYTVEDNYQHLDNTLSVLISHPSTDTAIGLSEIGSDGIVGAELDKYFVKHTRSLNWYELSDMNTLRDMGFSKHQYYMQIIPVDDTKFDRQEAKLKSIETVNGGVVDSVVRHKMLTYTETGVFYGENLLGKEDPTKPIIYFDEDDISKLNNNITMTFKDFISKSDETGVIKKFTVGDELPSSSLELNKDIEPIVTVNGQIAEYENKKGIRINLSDIVELKITKIQLGERGITYEDGFYFQFNVDDIIINNGTTNYNSSIREINEPYKIVAWSWFNE